MVLLDNGILQAAINPVGAELTSLKLDGMERIWQGNPAIWNRHAPLLFPLIGRLINQQYELDGRMIDAPMHGFCRDRKFAVASQSATEATFVTKDDEETYKVYPFHFRLEVTFRLEGNSVVKQHKVVNRSEREMPFELGGHDAYCTTLMLGEVMSDYAVAFEGCDHLEPFGMDASGALELPKSNVPLQGSVLEQLPEQLGLDTLVVENLPVRKATLFSRKSDRKVTIEFEDFPYLGIWTAQKGVTTNYLCLEPWSTLPDGHFMGRKLTDKPGIVRLSPGEEKVLTFRSTFE
jgi:galactose mutarotase-like enzyme